ncbi:hypothetical protein ASF61_05700 [Duganella sp. Leaf126]|uniref:acyltransferase domain-containing protein n=1 Tax=Duganella sp. Leaf126 TaxID=1736266 RepID=UPI0006F482E9|nr:acyltransferase domain-containing protein [Duganella sp. Leaf126]KQQ40270.1 hypothetical protein ASF61_05700 [Duganella sp. Leaf126]
MTINARYPSTEPCPELVFLFPGQGSQHYQMGRALFDADPAFRNLMMHLDAQFARREGVSLLARLYGSLTAATPLDDIHLSHPLVVMIEYCLATVLRQRGLHPDRVIASSAGEFAALAFTGRITIEIALDMMARQAQWASACVAPGFMLAAMAPRAWCAGDPEVRRLASIAGVGMASATVLSGRRDDLEHLETLLRGRGVAFSRLPVRVPFHSALMAPMHGHWMRRYAGNPHADTLWNVIRQPFDFPAALAALDRQAPCVLVDVGPSATLANWVRHGMAQLPAQWHIHGILSPWGGDVARLQQVLDLAAARRGGAPAANTGTPTAAA